MSGHGVGYEGMRRIVTGEELGEIGRYWTRWGARRALRSMAGSIPHSGAVEYVIEQRGWRWRVVAYQAKLVDESSFAR
jgi:hypothetical protein